MPTPAASNPAEPPIQTDDLEGTVDRIVAECDGDPRAAVRTLVVANSFLERELESVLAEVSRGYVRGRHDRIAHADHMAEGNSGER